MTEGDRHLLALEKDDFAIILEFQNQDALESYLQLVQLKGLKGTPIDLGDYLSTYRGHRYFDFHNPDPEKSFDIDFLLKSWELDATNHPEAGTDECFIH